MSPSPCNAEQPGRGRTTFQSLSREVRDAIYALALLAPSPIVVWSAELHSTYPKEQEGPAYYGRRTYNYKLQWDREAMASSLRDLAPGLLRCNRTIALEAASTFYGLNTFSFLGCHGWIPIICWLHTIGDLNRSYLTRLEASVRRLTTAWQYPDGTRARIHNYERNEFFPRNPHFSHLGAVPDGAVENINPSIETIIAMLGQCEIGPKLVFTWNLDFDLIPGIIINDLCEDAELSYFSMDLPNLVEKWRVDYTIGVRCRPVEVLWKAESTRKLAVEKRELIKDQGWEILEEEEAERLTQIQFEPREYGPYHTIKFTLRRKALTGPLVASDPSPWSWRSGPEP